MQTPPVSPPRPPAPVFPAAPAVLAAAAFSTAPSALAASAAATAPAAAAVSPGDALAAAYPLLRPLLAAEAAAQAPPGSGLDPDDLEQAVWLRLLELGGAPPAASGRWVAQAVGEEACAAARALAVVRPYDDDTAYRAAFGPGAADLALTAVQRRAVAAAVRTLPGRCPEVVTALMSRSDPTYREISRELGISQGSLGPLRSRCLGCLRTALLSRVGSPVPRGKAR